jgi:hypothetical protein
MKIIFPKTKTNIIDRIKYAYWSVLPYEYRPGNLWYSFKCWAWKRHTTIKSRYLDHTWHDKTTVLPHCMFEVLSQFIERECSPGIVDWYCESFPHKITVNGEEKWVRDEMQDIYDWWHNQYNKAYTQQYDQYLEDLGKYGPDELLGDAVEKNGKIIGYELSKDYKDEEKYDETSKGLRQLENKQREELKEYMHRLVNVVDYLWT